VQAPATDEWRAEIANIYQHYTIYYQSEGAEQPVFNSATGQAEPRSVRLTTLLRTARDWPATGRMLDIGCGNGSFLRHFNEQFPDWTLAGTEWDGKSRTQIESIPRVEKLYIGPLADIPGEFQFVSLIHVLEHIENPAAFLTDARERLIDGGCLFIEVPHYVDNPFELLIADHASHFTFDSMRVAVETAGFEILLLTNEWVPKELTLLARKTTQPPQLSARPSPMADLAAARKAVSWLSGAAQQAAILAANSPSFGIFGTSIAGTWLGGGLGEKVAFFVDEDPGRIGITHLGKPVYAPAAVPADSDIFVGLSPQLSSGIARRLARPGVRFHPVTPVA
jgi:SAM-dependent methyltransferase